MACILVAHATSTQAQTGHTRDNLARDTPATASREAASSELVSRDARLAREWGLRDDEWARYREVMDGPLGIYSPGLDPLTALGIEARSDEEQRRYAELQVKVEARRVEKLLTYQRAYDAAWQRLYPSLQRVNSLDGGNAAPAANMASGNGRIAVFVRDNCEACDQAVQRLQASGAKFDIYMLGSRADDSRIRDWARRVRLDAAKVREGIITLNHDGGRWLAIGLQGALPAVVRQVNGQWLRQ
ncbi:TIGR03759 family integrating conjugative element protein [Pseudomonas aeruginosa]|nr:TIGR03759 family integrating conjugative element protein [Pseudomonas aeruginosa]